MPDRAALVELPLPQAPPAPVPESFWAEVEAAAPRVWLVTCIAALVGSGLAMAGDFAALPLELRSSGLLVRAASMLYFAVGLWLGIAKKAWVSQHYRLLMMGVFPAVTIPVSLNGHWAGAAGDLYWFGILQLQLGASTFFSIPTPLFLAGAWLSNAGYLVARLGFADRPLTTDDGNVVVGLLIFGFLASVTHYVILMFRRESHKQRRQLYLQHQQKAQILASITDAFFALDHDWRVVFMNTAAEEIMAKLRPAGSMLSRQLWEEFPGLNDSLMYDEFHRAVESQIPVSYQEFYPLLDREVEVKAFPARDGLAVYFHDVTDLKRTQRALEEVRDNLEQRVSERTKELEEALVRLQAVAEERQAVSQQLQGSLAEKRQLAASLQAALERERTQLARDLHDELGQVLTHLRLELAWLQGHPIGDPDKISKLSAELLEVVDGALHSVRRIATDLRPPILDEGDVSSAIDWQCRLFAQRSRCQVHLDLGLSPQGVRGIGKDGATALFRILQEALTNVARHAQATAVFVELTDDGKAALLRVRDDGVGLGPGRGQGSGRDGDGPSDLGGLGILGMRERASALGGSLQVRTAATDRGVEVEVRMPWQSDTGPGGEP